MHDASGQIGLVHIAVESHEPVALRELVVDLVRSRLIGARGEVSFTTMDQLRGLFEVLVEARGEDVSLPDLFARVWRSRWVSPEHHRAAIHTQICRARRLLGRVGQRHRLVSSRSGYALKLDERCAVLHADAPAPAAVGENVDAVLLEQVRERGWATNREIRRRCARSRTTVFRAIQRLVASGDLVAVGGGRSVRYTLGAALPAEMAPAA